MIYFYCTSWQFFQMIVKWRISPTTEQIMFTFSILLFHFYSHIPCGMWLSYIWSIKITKIISTHTSRVGCDRYTDWSEILVINFYSHIPCGMWRNRSFLFHYLLYFYSHIPCGMWRTCGFTLSEYIRFLLTHPVWDVTAWRCSQQGQTGYFYSHIPCGMWRTLRTIYHHTRQFLLTHPVWDVTISYHVKTNGIWFLLTHPVWDVTSPLWYW